jgi:thiamine biosynthesis lipoprotein
MGTAWSIRIESPPASLDVPALQREVVAYLADFDRKVSTYRNDSEVSRFNVAPAGEWFSVSVETAQLVQRAIELAETSGGVFDPTIGPLTQLWKFDRHEGLQSVPSEAEIAAARDVVGFRRLTVRQDHPALRKDLAGLTLNLNAIAPGWAVDRLAERLNSHGVHNYLVDVGSEIRTSGRKADGSSWTIGIERPSADGSKRILEASIPLDDLAVSTSGDYRNFYMIDGVRYSHTIDPRTGRPVRHGLASVTVVATDCATADGLATAVTVLGPVDGLVLAERLDLAVWMMVRREGDVLEPRSSSAFQSGVGRRMVQLHDPAGGD